MRALNLMLIPKCYTFSPFREVITEDSGNTANMGEQKLNSALESGPSSIWIYFLAKTSRALI